MGHFRSIYKGSKSKGGGGKIADLDATMYAVQHAVNSLDMTQLISTITDARDKIDLMAMMDIAERKLEWWKRQTNQSKPELNFDMKKFLTIFSAAKKGKRKQDKPESKQKDKSKWDTTPAPQSKRRKKQNKGWKAKRQGGF